MSASCSHSELASSSSIDPNVRDHLAKCQSVEEQAESFPPTSATLLGGLPLPGATRPNPQPTLEKLARDDADQTTSRLT